MFEAGLALHEQGDLVGAEAAYRAVLAQASGNADALHMLGVLMDQQGHGEAAVALIRRAIASGTERAFYFSNLGNALYRLGRLEEAVAAHRRAVALRPDSVAMLGNLAAALLGTGDGSEAVELCRRAVRLAPGSAEAWLRLGNALSAVSDTGADAALLACLRLEPARAEALYNLGCLALQRCDAKAAEGWFRMAVAAQPGMAAAHMNLGVALHRLGLLANAAACNRAALGCDPGLVEAWRNLGCVALGRNRAREAAEAFGSALALRHDDGIARFGLCAAQLPILYRDEAEVAASRAGYTACLDGLADDVALSDGLAGLAQGAGSSPPFFLAYQGGDDRALQAKYGALCCRLVEGLYGPAPLRGMRGDGRIRVAVVSGFFCRHTVWSLLLHGWLTYLDRERFIVTAYHVGTIVDEVTAHAAALADCFVQGARTLSEWRRAVLQGAPDVVLYPEVGMDPVSAHLAAQRLAPVQATSWGHPVTSGMPSMDLFLSSALMEPDGAQAHYTERLVQLPNLGTCYEPPGYGLEPASRVALGLRSGSIVYWSGQALYKYHPRYDDVFARIAAEVGECQFAFIEFARAPEVTALFRERLDQAFARRGLQADQHCVFLPQLSQDGFVAAVGACDVVLDTPGWSGGKSTLDGLAHVLPIVTLAGTFMRARHGAAILRRMGAGSLVTDSLDDYVALAVRLGRDPVARSAAAAIIGAGRERLWQDRSCVAAMGEALERAVRHGPATPVIAC